VRPSLLTASALVLCALPASCTGPARHELPPDQAQPPAAAVLGPDGVVHCAGEDFPLEDPARMSALLAELDALAQGETLRLATERGTSLELVERWMDALAAAGIEDYRIDLNRVR